MAPIAARLEAQTGVPAKMLITQWVIESKWGAEPVGEHGYFGIKRDQRHTKICLVTARECFTEREIAAWNRCHPDHPARVVGRLDDGRFDVRVEDEFADYASLEDYAWLISHGDPYRKAWVASLADRDLNVLIDGVARVYGTGQKYSGLAKQIAGQSNIAAAVQAARMA